MAIFQGDFIIRTAPGNVRTIMRAVEGERFPQTVASVVGDESGDAVLNAVKEAIAVAGGTLTDEDTGLVVAGDIGEMVESEAR